MKIQQLTLRNFRNHSLFQINPHLFNNFFIGDNGQGKTAVLEALSLLLDGRSFRQGSQWIQSGFQESLISAKVQHEMGVDECQLILSKTNSPQYLINGQKKKNPFKRRSVFVTYRDLFAIREDGSHRRRLIDDLVTYFDASVVRSFKKILEQKNRFLKLCKKGAYSLFDQSHLLDSLNSSFFEKAKNLIDHRFEQMQKMNFFWRDHGLFLLSTSDFFVHYKIGEQLVRDKEQAIDCLSQDMTRLKAIEKIQGVSLAGPHRHDLRFFLKKQEAREALSSGQQKAMLLSWKMAHWDYICSKTDIPPILFLDDIFSEIDQHFVKNLLVFLMENKAQNFVTTTNQIHPFDSKKGKIFFLGERKRNYVREQKEQNL